MRRRTRWRRSALRRRLRRIDRRIIAAVCCAAIAAAALLIAFLPSGEKQTGSPIAKASKMRSGDVRQQGGRIIGFISESDGGAADGFGAFAQALIKQGSIDEYLVYSADSDKTQQIQDVRSMLNKGCGVIVTDGVSRSEFEIIAQLASKAGARVVAIDAPVSSGFELNITASENDIDALAASVREKVSASSAGVISKKSGDSDDKAFRSAISNNFSQATIIGAYSESGSYSDQLEAIFAAKPEVVFCSADVAAEFIKAAAEKNAFPEVLVTEAAAGALCEYGASGRVKLSLFGRDFYVKRTELAAQISVSDECVGRAACYAAGMLVSGGDIPDGSQIALAGELISDENIDRYIKSAEELPPEQLLTGSADYTALKELFESDESMG